MAHVRLLAGAGRSATEIALVCGFTHFGRFAQTYNAACGELPISAFRRAKPTSDAIRIVRARIG